MMTRTNVGGNDLFLEITINILRTLKCHPDIRRTSSFFNEIFNEILLRKDANVTYYH